MAYDFMYDNEKIVINEMSYCYASSAVSQCNGYWDSNLNWHDKKMKPEEAHVEDFIKEVEKKINKRGS